MKNVQAVEIVFENCESIKIESKYFGYLLLNGFEKSIQRIACNSISCINTAETVAIELFSEGNIEYHPFGIPDEKTNSFERIQEHYDITSLRIFYDENDYEDYYVDYEEEGDYLGSPNKNQKVYLSELGNLYIVIGEDKNIEDFFEKETINDEEYIKFHKEMTME